MVGPDPDLLVASPHFTYYSPYPSDLNHFLVPSLAATKQACKRNMDCKCPECLAASAAFSVDDLRSITSNIRYGATRLPC